MMLFSFYFLDLCSDNYHFLEAEINMYLPNVSEEAVFGRLHYLIIAWFKTCATTRWSLGFWSIEYRFLGGGCLDLHNIISDKQHEEAGHKTTSIHTSSFNQNVLQDLLFLLKAILSFFYLPSKTSIEQIKYYFRFFPAIREKSVNSFFWQLVLRSPEHPREIFKDISRAKKDRMGLFQYLLPAQGKKKSPLSPNNYLTKIWHLYFFSMTCCVMSYAKIVNSDLLYS